MEAAKVLETTLRNQLLVVDKDNKLIGALHIHDPHDGKGDLMEIQEIAKQIKLVILDVDGVLSDGCINISGDGELLSLSLYVTDWELKFLQDAGIAVAICTGRTSDIVEERARELGIKLVMQGEKDKRVGFYQHLHTSQC